jgi:hypothetical protein
VSFIDRLATHNMTHISFQNPKRYVVTNPKLGTFAGYSGMGEIAGIESFLHQNLKTHFRRSVAINKSEK